MLQEPGSSRRAACKQLGPLAHAYDTALHAVNKSPADMKMQPLRLATLDTSRLAMQVRQQCAHMLFGCQCSSEYASTREIMHTRCQRGSARFNTQHASATQHAAHDLHHTQPHHPWMRLNMCSTQPLIVFSFNNTGLLQMAWTC
jgi:hypothetical protein